MVGQHCRERRFVRRFCSRSTSSRTIAGVRRRARHWPMPGWLHYERATVGSLPYGVQKRIELVRALMAKPRLLLLDEPAAGLNPAETEALRERIDAICRDRGMTLLVVEHDMHFVGALCDAGRSCSISAARSPKARPSRCAKMRLVQRSLSWHRRARRSAPCVLRWTIFTFATAACMRCAASR